MVREREGCPSEGAFDEKMRTELYLIRHGQSEGNLHHLFLGHSNRPLTPTGHRQAELAARFLVEKKPDVLYTSDLGRTMETAQHTADLTGLPLIFTEKMREIDAGEWEGRSFEDLFAAYPEETRMWWEETGLARPTGGESVAELQERIMKELSRIARENPDKTVCVFTHFTPIYAVKTALAGVPLSEMKHQPKPGNASITHLIYENGAFQLKEYSRNDFLGDMMTDLESPTIYKK